MVPVDCDAEIRLASGRYRLLPARRRERAILGHDLRREREVVRDAGHSAVRGPGEGVGHATREILSLVREDPEGANVRGHDVDLDLGGAGHHAVSIERHHGRHGRDLRLEAVRHDVDVGRRTGLLPLHRWHHAAGHDHIVQHELHHRHRLVRVGHAVGHWLELRHRLPSIQEEGAELDNDRALQKLRRLHLRHQRHRVRTAVPREDELRVVHRALRCECRGERCAGNRDRRELQADAFDFVLQHAQRVLLPDHAHVHLHGLALDLHRCDDDAGTALAVDDRGACGRGSRHRRVLAVLQDGDLDRRPDERRLVHHAEGEVLDVVGVLADACAHLVARHLVLAVRTDFDDVVLARWEADHAPRIDSELVSRHSVQSVLLHDGDVEEGPEREAHLHVLHRAEAARQPHRRLQHHAHLEVVGEEHPRGRRELDVNRLGGQVVHDAEVGVEVHDAQQQELGGQAHAQGALQKADVVRLKLATEAWLDGERSAAEVESDWVHEHLVFRQVLQTQEWQLCEDVVEH
mmetsp:Transcript_82890/g.268651  ORF Transcript_82890/g.268651 Transcript_82890/m.268651 type:complete len:519 (+) Transcript_82890:918-2474(+)